MTGQSALSIVLTIAFVAVVTNALPPKKIIGGQKAAAGEFPYQALLKVDGKPLCGGAIIGERHILTAAHCVVGIVTAPYTNLLIVTGSINSKSGQTHTVKTVLYHASYNRGYVTSPNDIALIVLVGNINFNENQNKVALPEAMTQSGVIATVTGWGYNRTGSLSMVDDLMKIQVKTLTAIECQKYLTQTAVLYTHQICTFSIPGVGICQGDSGGPLVYNGQLIGIVSFNVPCGRGYPDVYSSVYHYLDWIQKVIAMPQSPS